LAMIALLLLIGALTYRRRHQPLPWFIKMVPLMWLSTLLMRRYPTNLGYTLLGTALILVPLYVFLKRPRLEAVSKTLEAVPLLHNLCSFVSMIIEQAIKALDKLITGIENKYRGTTGLSVLVWVITLGPKKRRHRMLFATGAVLATALAMITWRSLRALRAGGNWVDVMIVDVVAAISIVVGIYIGIKTASKSLPPD